MLLEQVLGKFNRGFKIRRESWENKNYWLSLNGFFSLGAEDLSAKDWIAKKDYVKKTISNSTFIGLIDILESELAYLRIQKDLKKFCFCKNFLFFDTLISLNFVDTNIISLKIEESIVKEFNLIDGCMDIADEIIKYLNMEVEKE